MTKSIVFRSARVFDGESEALRIGVNVFVQGGVISNHLLEMPPVFKGTNGQTHDWGMGG